ncbi:MAG TPA: rRNA maturation RNase YbeY [Acidimicrobiales bacterium]|nr:rRNA maturation RNase YbeY [Acidimicrobiales bacterium]
MGADVFVADEQSALQVDVERWAELARSVLDAEGVGDDVEVSLLFVDEPAIAELNERFLGNSGPTDVLAFPIDDEAVPGGRSPDEGGTGPGGPLSSEEEPVPMLLGDVVVCPTVARRHAEERERSVEDEMALLVVHGLLHLLGMDHADSDEAERMERREQQLLSRFWRSTG